MFTNLDMFRVELPVELWLHILFLCPAEDIVTWSKETWYFQNMCFKLLHDELYWTMQLRWDSIARKKYWAGVGFSCAISEEVWMFIKENEGNSTVKP